MKIGSAKPPWYLREFWPTVIGSVVALITQSISLYKMIVALPEKTPTGFIYGALGVGITASLVTGCFGIVRSSHRDRKLLQENTLKDLAGCLEVMYRLVLAHKKISVEQDRKEHLFRTTLHAVRADGFEQCVPYVGGQPDGGIKVGRKFRIAIGVVGRSIRTGQPVKFSRKSPDEQKYRDELIAEWGFTKADVESVSIDRHSSLAVPISGDDGNVVAVIYADAKEPTFFTEDAVELIVAAAEGAAAYIRYRR